MATPSSAGGTADLHHGTGPLPAAVPLIDPKTLYRRLGYIMLVRVILFTLVLGGTVGVNLALGTPEELGGPYVTFLFVFIALVYVLNIGYAVWLRLARNLRLQAAVQVGVDLLIDAVLVHFTGGSDSLFVLFFLLAPIFAAVTLDRRGALIVAIAGLVLFAGVALMGYAGWLPPLPGQPRLPWDLTPGSLGRSLLVNGIAMVALAILSGYLAEQLRFVAERVEVQQAHIDDLAALNTDIIRCLTSGLITVSLEGRILSMNQAAGEILGIPHHQAAGRMVSDLPPELARAISDDRLARRVEIPLERGSTTQLLGVSVSPLTDHLNQTRGRVINFQDLTQIRQMEARMKRSEHLASLGRISAGIAHEIRNPLASISGSLELLRAGDQLEDDDRRLMDIARREIDRLNGLVTDFLDYARPKPATLETLDLGLKIHELAGDIRDLLEGGEDTPAVEVECTERELWVQADADRLRAVLWNLVRNAAEGGERQRVRISIASRGDAVLMQVADHGDGIPADELEHVFEPFFTTKERGTGLGLSTVHRTIQEHGGSVDVASEPGHGTTFTISLPRSPPPSLG